MVHFAGIHSCNLKNRLDWRQPWIGCGMIDKTLVFVRRGLRRNTCVSPQLLSKVVDHRVGGIEAPARPVYASSSRLQIIEGCWMRVVPHWNRLDLLRNIGARGNQSGEE